MTSNLILFFGLVGLAAFITGLSKGGLGGQMAGIVTPILALVMPAKEVIGLVLPMLICGDLIAITFYWRTWDWRQVRRLLPGSLIGVTVAALFITHAPEREIKLGLGAIVLLFTIYKLLEKLILKNKEYKPHGWHAWLAGAAAGFASTIAHNGGPPITIYLLFQEMPSLTFVGTSALYFMILNWIKVPYYFYAHLFDLNLILRTLWVLPLVPLGIWVGQWTVRRIDQRAFENLMVALLALTGLLLFLP